ncbi:hypothetical protein GCM10009077_02040 [Roseibium denhamense]
MPDLQWFSDGVLSVPERTGVPARKGPARSAFSGKRGRDHAKRAFAAKGRF